MPETRPLADFSLDYPLIAGRIESLDAGTKERRAIVLVVLEGAHQLAADQRTVSAQVMIELAGRLVDEMVDHVSQLAEELGCNHRGAPSAADIRERFAPSLSSLPSRTGNDRGEHGTNLHVVGPLSEGPPATW